MDTRILSAASSTEDEKSTAASVATNVATNTIACNIDEPWDTWIREGKKTFECRIPQKGSKWEKITVGDTLAINPLGQSGRKMRVVSVTKYVDFDAAYLQLGEKMVPNLPDVWRTLKVEHSDLLGVNELYYYASKKNFTSKLIAEFGVIAIEIAPLKS